MTIPNGWLCYLSPEIMRCLRPGDQQNETLPFSSSSDVFAFGLVASSYSIIELDTNYLHICSTLWFELLYGEWPFKGYFPEEIIWRVGSGFKPALSNLTASKEIKVYSLLYHNFMFLIFVFHSRISSCSVGISISKNDQNLVFFWKH